MPSFYCFCFLLLIFSKSANAINPAMNPEPMNSFSLQGVLGQQASGQESGFAQALRPMAFQFPRDHLAHPAYKTEWWYFTGNLTTDNASEDEHERAFAYQFTLFRFALQPEKQSPGKSIVSKSNSSATQRPKQNSISAWRSDNIYMAHIALTDIKQARFYQQERFSRDGLALAGAGKKDDGFLQFWLHDWQAKSLAEDRLFPLRLTIQGKQFALELQLIDSKPMVLQGEQGLSQKSGKPGNASYYYSYSHLASQGSIKVGDETYRVSGTSWFDREWSTSSLGEEQQGWDWLALHLDDGSELMLYQMRKKDGSKDRYSSGILVDQQGKSITLRARQFQLQAMEFWQSPVSGIRYPIQWQVMIPEQAMKLIISTPVRQQEWSKAAGYSFNYWEGAVEVRGSKEHQPISGSGYLEMTGYQ